MEQREQLAVLVGCLGGELRHVAAVIVFGVELGVPAVGAAQKAVGDGGEGDKADAQLLERGEQRFILARHHGIAVFHRRHRADRVRPAQIVLVRFRNAPVQDLALADEVGHHARNRLRLDRGVDAVLEVQVDVVGPEACERAPDRSADDLRAGVRDERLVDCCAGFIKGDAELADDLHLIAYVFERRADQFFVVVRVGLGAVCLGGVEKGVANVIGRADHADGFAALGGRAVGMAETHAAEADRRDAQAVAQFTKSHGETPPLVFISGSIIGFVPEMRKFRFVLQYIPLGNSRRQCAGKQGQLQP